MDEQDNNEAQRRRMGLVEVLHQKKIDRQLGTLRLIKIPKTVVTKIDTKMIVNIIHCRVVDLLLKNIQDFDLVIEVVIMNMKGLVEIESLLVNATINTNAIRENDIIVKKEIDTIEVVKTIRRVLIVRLVDHHRKTFPRPRKCYHQQVIQLVHLKHHKVQQTTVNRRKTKARHLLQIHRHRQTVVHVVKTRNVRLRVMDTIKNLQNGLDATAATNDPVTTIAVVRRKNRVRTKNLRTQLIQQTSPKNRLTNNKFFHFFCILYNVRSLYFYLLFVLENKMIHKRKNKA